MKYLLGVLIAGVALVIGVGSDAGEKKAKYEIAEVMKKAHAGKGAIMKAVAAGKANEAEKKQLVELYTALALNTPPKGDEKEFKAKATKLLEAAKKAADGDEKAAKSLLKLANCKACHDVHKN